VVPEAGARQLELRDYVNVLRRRKAIIALTVLLVVGAALAFSYAQTPVYEATAEVLVQPRVSEQILTPSADGSSRAVDPQRAVDTEIKVLESRTVEAAVRRKLGRLPKISASHAGQTDVIRVRVRSTKASEAAADANTYARTYIDVRRQQAIDDFLSAGQQVQAKIVDLQRQMDALPTSLTPDPSVDAQRVSLGQQQAYYRQQLDQLQVAAQISRSGGSQVVSRATTPTSPVEPETIRNGLIALALGLLLGIGLAFLREYLDDSIRTKDDLERASGGLPVIGLIPMVSGWKNRQTPYLATAADPTSPAAEAYRTLRTSVQFLGLDRPLHALIATSPTKQEGKTTTLANLAVTLAKADQRTILLDCDLRRPRIHKFFGLSNESGFTSVLLGTDPLGEAIRPVDGYPALAVLASGPRPPDPSELLSSQRTREVLDALRSRCDLLLIDSPPILPVSDTLALSAFVDATLLVGSANQTSRRALHRAIELLRQVNASLVGTVLNEVGPEGAYAYAYAGYAFHQRPAVGEEELAPNGRRGRRQASSQNQRRSTPGRD
jgi:succinoglycan biosynthesis transport protein ExoP